MKGELPIGPEDVTEIVAILDGSSYDRLDVRTASFRLRVARAEGADGWTQEWDFSDDAPAAIAEAEIQAPEAEIPQGMTAVRAALPGTFYRAPQPGAPPFVAEGDAVEPDTVVGIVETMKLMNPVSAGAAGRIAAILVDNATMVAAGAALMLIE
ncbi:MAG: biotin carboxyl carrier domain-containing protein [Sphingomonadaceae bacterium]|nr:biotin carboxyl carrier domain-containing protein [Sphingomonadaceae bacterium]